MSNDITEPLRLATGSHKAGSGKGCAMNVISWENGDEVITDYPSCSYRPLARLVQGVNDNICTHRAGNLLCPECSATVLELGHATVGTAGASREQEAAWTAELLDSPDWGVSRFDTSGKCKAVARLYRRRASGDEPSAAEWNTANAACSAAYNAAACSADCAVTFRGCAAAAGTDRATRRLSAVPQGQQCRPRRAGARSPGTGLPREWPL